MIFVKSTLDFCTSGKGLFNRLPASLAQLAIEPVLVYAAVQGPGIMGCIRIDYEKAGLSGMGNGLLGPVPNHFEDVSDFKRRGHFSRDPVKILKPVFVADFRFHHLFSNAPVPAAEPVTECGAWPSKV